MKILYCIDKNSKRKIPAKLFKTHDIKDAYCPEYPVVVFDDKFLTKRKNLKIRLLSQKTCLIHFTREDKSNLKTVRQFGFFDCFTDKDSKNNIDFKLKRAHVFSLAKQKVANLENVLSQRDKKMGKVNFVDPLTGCYNWRYFLNRVRQELNHSRRYLGNISFMGVDIDNFRKISEIYGVEVVDAVIKELVKILKESLRREDILVHWTAGEFFIIIHHLDSKNVRKIAQRIKDKISLRKFKYKKLSLTLKASIGIVSLPQDNISNTRDIISAIDRCLTVAKRKGGNAVVSYSQSRFRGPSQRRRKMPVGELRRRIDKMNMLLTRDLLEMIYGFARAIEAKDSYTAKHVEYTARLAGGIAENLHLSKDEVEGIKHAAVLHDLGKVGIEESILSKKGALTAKEREVIKRHPSIAADILREIHALRDSVPAVLYHHERYDGKGYPLGLKGQEIPLSARIVAVADVYQALISDRPYRKSHNKRKALAIIKRGAGKQFDPKIVKVFLKVISKIDEKI